MADVDNSPEVPNSSTSSETPPSNNSKDSPALVLNGEVSKTNPIKIKGATVWKDANSSATTTHELSYNNNNTFVTLVSGGDPATEVTNFDTTTFDAGGTVWLDKTIPGLVLHSDQVFPLNGNFPPPTQATMHLGNELKGHYQNQRKVSPSRRRYTPSNSRGSSPCNQGVGTCPGSLLAAAAAAAGPPTPALAGQHVVHLHVNPGETISFQMGDQVQLIQGPATVRMVSSNSTPPIPMPVQVPPGHMVQQIVDENGTLRHIILSPQPAIAVHPMTSASMNTPPYNPGATANSGTPFFAAYPHGPYGHPAQFHPHPGMQPPTGLHGLHTPTPPLQTPHQCNSHNTNSSGAQHQGSNGSNGHPSNHNGGQSGAQQQLHKDERAQRQMFRLKRKLEARQKEPSISSSNTTAAGLLILQHSSAPAAASTVSSPKKDGVSRRYRNGNSSTQSLDGSEENQSLEDEEETQMILELLGSIKAAVVTEVVPRGGCIQWRSPELCNEDGEPKYSDLFIQESEFLYEVLLSDKGKDFKAKPLYSGNQLEFRMEDLRPATEYFVCVRAILDGLTGAPSECTSFRTEPCEPDVPQPPKLATKSSRTSLTLKWTATLDNGSKITSYILEYDEGKGDQFVEVYSGLQKQFKVTKLTASTCYRFRLVAVNEIGKSGVSEVVSVWTSGNVPSQPGPPCLRQSFSNRIQLEWVRKLPDEEFILQMEDEATRHGFLPIYNGRETSYTCSALRRNTEYKFRLCAKNEEGASPWSKVVSFATLPERPSHPGKPTAKGKVRSNGLRLEWEPPKDDGGSPVTSYIVEIDKGSGFEALYSGIETDCPCEQLTPGATYRLRTACLSRGGQSPFSEVGVVTTACICPGKCSPPRLHGKPKAFTLHLKWGYPSYDGGSSVTEFEIDMTSPDNTTRSAYRGRETDCVVAGLLPGRPYLFQVRASNKMGPGPWSDPLEVVSGAGPPDPPPNLSANCRSPHAAVVTWGEPTNNGAPITEYRLEASLKRDLDYCQLFQGFGLSYESKNLTPATVYYFRIQALNSAGIGPPCEPVSLTTMPSSPGVVSSSSMQGLPTADSLLLSWKAPPSCGSDILHYNIELGPDVLLTTPNATPEFIVQDLIPETVYRVRIQAVNSMGVGPFSSSLKVCTLGLPPVAPPLECLASTHSSLKLKWGEGRNPDFVQYTLLMENRTGSFVPIYQGPSHCHKVSKLSEMTSHHFRIFASNSAGDGPHSPMYVFKTCKAPPPPLKAPRVTNLSERSCEVEWSEAKSSSTPVSLDPVSYLLQLILSKESEYQMVYKGSATNFTLQNLEARVSYALRVAAVRHSSEGDLQGAWSPPCPAFVLPSSETGRTGKIALAGAASNSCGASVATSERKPLTDQQWAIIILCSFTLFAIFVAMVIERLISYSKPSS